MGPGGHVRSFIFYSLKYPCPCPCHFLGGFSFRGTFLASNVTKVAVISDWKEFGWINGTWWTCQMSRFGDGGHARCSMGPTRSLERVFFSLKSPFHNGVQRHILSLQCHQRGCYFWLEWFGWLNGTWWTCQMSRFGDGGHVRCSMSPK